MRETRPAQPILKTNGNEIRIGAPDIKTFSQALSSPSFLAQNVPSNDSRKKTDEEKADTKIVKEIRRKKRVKDKRDKAQKEILPVVRTDDYEKAIRDFKEQWGE